MNTTRLSDIYCKRTPRTMITVNQATGTPWTEGWHRLKVIRKVEDGTIEVFFDSMDKPLMTAQDKTFA
jgi:hypothetical protein